MAKLGIEDLVNLAVLPNRTPEESLAITLEICDWVTSQKRDGPQKACDVLLAKINSRNERLSLPALEILDSCVKNCGFPFHLQIASKKFLNELVRFFPEKPPSPLPPTLKKILELIEFWKISLSERSRYKDDLSLISSMHRLLSSKGYKFPHVKMDPSLVVDETSLLTAEELLEQDRKAQAAKLDELLRRGTPQDLAEANELMKLMAGYDMEKQPDYQAQVNDQIKRLESDCKDTLIILNTLEPGDDPTAHAKLQELMGRIKSSRPKVQKWIEEETDEAKIGLLLGVNDLMNNVFEVYGSLKSALNKPASRTSVAMPSPSPLPSTGAAPAAGTAAASAATQPPRQTPAPAPAPAKKEVSLIDLDFDEAPSASSSSSSSTMFSGFAGLSLSPAPQQPQAQNTSLFFPASTAPPAYPGSAPAIAPPSAAPASASAFLPSPTQTPAFPAFDTPQGGGQGLDQDNDSEFSGFQGPEPPAPAVALVLARNGLEVHMKFEREDTSLSIQAKYSNTQAVPMTDFMIQYAVPKSMKLKLENLSSTTLAPVKMGGQPSTQRIVIENPTGAPLRIRYKANFKVSGTMTEEQGELQNIPQL